MPAAIEVEHLSKSYRLGTGDSGAYRTLRESLVDGVGALGRRLRRSARPPEHPEGPEARQFWALKDVSFEVQPGDVVGIVGRNGAGKSTVLKILSRITEPTSGRAIIQGRIGSLLEVGTGFHPELTGRENIFLNGSILGMTRFEVSRKFDEIVGFAEVDKFLDVPVKRYSSGMYMRLAFAVAAHLQPEILIVDEVLAVGDLAFQKKCMNRMQDVGHSGSSVLFVSHNMAAIEALCTRALLIDRGEITRDGTTAAVIGEYHRQSFQLANSGRSPATLDHRGVIQSAVLLDEREETTDHLLLGGRFRLRITLDIPGKIKGPTVGLGIDDIVGSRLLSVHSPLLASIVEEIAGSCYVDCVIDPFPLAPGDYWVKLAVSVAGSMLDDVERVLSFSVVDGELFHEGRGFHRGVCVAPSTWIPRRRA